MSSPQGWSTRTMDIIKVVVMVLWLGNTVQGRNTQDICQRDPPGTTANKTPGDNGFRIRIAGRPPPERYTPDQVYTISINGTYPNQQLLGFMLVAVPFNARDETTAMGTFQHMNLGLTQLADQCPHVVTHTFRNSKAGVEVLWTAPPVGTGCVEFRATVIEYEDIWYKDDGALTYIFCEETGTTEDHQSPEMIPDCCACGAAKYQMTFEGVWSRQTHPKDFPKHKRLLHWSNIVGASHSKKYMIWQYGDYSSRSVKEVCEFGYTRTMEEEMRTHSRDVRTVIKTPGIWWSDELELKETRWARFSVDKKKHLVTLLTMLGPSPDWCVGVSALNLCLSNCTWASDLTFDLHPWDAGTDNGITYTSANSRSDPPQKIHKLTDTFPNNPASPFFGQDIPPLAYLKLHRIQPKPGETAVCTGNSDEDDNFDIEISESEGDGSPSDKDMLKNPSMMKTGKCAVSDWLDWSECSVTCGVGKRMRKRMYLHPDASESMCGQPLIEAENCIGFENWCEHPDEDCSMTPWSDWSPCSVTCAKGVTERRRYFLDKEDMATCERTTEEREMCIADVMDCQKAFLAKNFTAICSLPQNVGPCRGSFQRWYYDTTMRKCLPFTYGGCRGNDNKFLTQEDCDSMCQGLPEGDGGARVIPTPGIPERQPTTPRGKVMPGKTRPGRQKGNTNTKKDMNNQGRGDKVDCMITPWTEWSECDAECGKAWKERIRMVKREPENGGKDCPKKMSKKKRCKVPKCHDLPVDCAVSDWSKWTVCSAPCGRGFKFKRRIITVQPHTNGHKCPTKLERRRKCPLPRCSVNCKLGEWGEWSSCGSTCGDNSIQERTRPIVHMERRGGEPCGTRIERRYCSLPSCDQEMAHSEALLSPHIPVPPSIPASTTPPPPTVRTEPDCKVSVLPIEAYHQISLLGSQKLSKEERLQLQFMKNKNLGLVPGRS